MSAQEPLVPPTVAEELRFSAELPSVHRRRVSMASSLQPVKPDGFRAGMGLQNMARRTLGIILLLLTVFLWTASNFLASVSQLYTWSLVKAVLTISSIFLQITHTRNHTLSLISTPRSSPFRYFQSCYASFINTA